jgi:hypothetical protein
MDGASSKSLGVERIGGISPMKERLCMYGGMKLKEYTMTRV